MGNILDDNIIQINKINFEHIQTYIQQPHNFNNIYLINTLSINEQTCLIPHTVSIHNEENIINDIIKKKHTHIKIYLYGKNTTDPQIQKQYIKFIELGISKHQIYIYLGGMFEWLLLQDVFGYDAFPTTSTQLDILHYK